MVVVGVVVAEVVVFVVPVLVGGLAWKRMKGEGHLLILLSSLSKSSYCNIGSC